MSWQDLTGKRVRVAGEVGHVVHVDLLRVVVMTEGENGDAPHRMIVSQEDGLDVEVLEERREHGHGRDGSR